MNDIGAPQIIWFILAGAGLMLACYKHGDQSRINAGSTTISTILSFLLLLWGGFFS